MAVEPSVQHESVSCPYVNDQSHCFVCPTPHSLESTVPQPVVHKEKCGGGGGEVKEVSSCFNPSVFLPRSHPLLSGHDSSMTHACTLGL